MRLLTSIGCAAFALAASTAAAFPPYRTTDAETAGAGMLELRLGLLKIRRTGSTSERRTPLTRTNIGIGSHYEVVSELEYSPDDHQLGEGALGFKWARLNDGRGIGVETLTLLPVQSSQGGAGLESQFVATFQQERWRLHVNAGGFYDPRGAQTERGWRASLLAEFPRERIRPGVELFVKDAHSEGARVQTGIGLIAQLDRFEVRAGLHLGLTNEAPDLEASVWFAWKWRVRSAGRQ